MADTSLAERKIGLLIWQLSNLWQSKLRKILKDYKLTLNEYLILESIFDLSKNQKELSQNRISIFAGIDVSVASVTFKLLENKKLIMRRTKKDNRKKIIAWGVAAAFLFRIMFAFGANYMFEFPWIKILGGVFLFWIINDLRQDLFQSKKIKSPIKASKEPSYILVSYTHLTLPTS